jgi:FMN phosphatase YigB (HAD superfamily)
VSREVSAEEIWRPLFRQYNQSYKGLRQGGFQFDRDEYWRCHRRGVENFLSENVALGAMLAELPHRKVIFTNCREREASEALVALGIESHFERIFGADFLADSCKVGLESVIAPTAALTPPLPARP